MLELIEANQIALAAILLLGVFVAWWVWGRAKPAKKGGDYKDVLSDGAAQAQRNTALIDAPSAAALVTPPPGAGLMAGIGEVIAAAATEEVAVAAASEPAPAAVPAAGEADDLARIKGVGPKLKAALNALGVTTYAQIAAWTEDDIKKIDAQLGTFAGRATRDNWIEQCKFLADGDTAGYEGKFGKL